MKSGTVRLSVAEVRELCEAALVANRVAPSIAASVASALALAQQDGQGGHGVSRLAAYAAQARSGKVDGFATPTAARPRPSFIEVDARFGFAFPALELARRALIETAQEQGVAAAAIRNSHHCGVLGHQVEALAEAGLVAIMVANAPKCIAPWGGRAPIFGTNPIAFAAPRDGAPPLVIDMAVSLVARGKVMAASKTGESIPEGWALDEAGQPTTDPHAALKGTMAPAGDAKGAALALMVEILAGALAGPHFSFEATDFFAAEGEPPALGQFLIAIRPGDATAARVTALLDEMTSQEGVRVPGDKRLAMRAQSLADGVVAPALLIDEARALAGAAS